jgi:nucleoside-diphosphate-sugar epimerase
MIDLNAYTEGGTREVIEAFSGMITRLVVASSCDVYRAYDRLRKKDPGQPDPAPLTEDSPLREKLFPYREPATDPDEFSYHYEKILVERAAMSDPKLPATIVRLPMIYGPGDYQHRLYPYLKRMDDGRKTILLPHSAENWMAPRGFVGNIAKAIELCAFHPRAAGRIFNVADSFLRTEREWIHEIGVAAGWDGEIVALPDSRMPKHLAPDLDFSQDWTVDSERIRQDLGYFEIYSQKEALRKTVDWERAHPPEKVNPADFDYALEDTALGG